MKTETSRLFHVSGDKDFIEEFEKLLIANNIGYSKGQHEPSLSIRNRTEIRKRTDIKNGTERQTQLRNPLLYVLTFEQIIDFVLRVTPSVISIIGIWYGSRRKKGKIVYETEEGTFEVEAENITKSRYTKKHSKKKTQTKKRKKEDHP
jgi:hypothetical protein